MFAASQICPWFAAPSPKAAMAIGMGPPGGALYLAANARPAPTGTCTQNGGDEAAENRSRD